MRMKRFAYWTATLILTVAYHSANSQATSGVYSTYLGGSADDGFCGIQITIDSLGYIYAAGYTLSDDIPIAGSPYQPDRDGGYDIFVAKFDPHLTTLLAARLWLSRWPYLLMFTAWLGLSALVYFWSAPTSPSTDLAFLSSAATPAVTAQHGG